MRKHILLYSGGIMIVFALSACGSNVPRPSSELALAASALESAELSGAREYAPIELRTAREKKDAADKAIAEEKYTKARYLTVEAKVDADLARASAEAEKSRLDLLRAQDNIETLRADFPTTSNNL